MSPWRRDKAALGRYARLMLLVISWNAYHFGTLCPVLLVSFGDLQPSVAPGAIWKPLSKFPPPGGALCLANLSRWPGGDDDHLLESPVDRQRLPGHQNFGAYMPSR